MCRFAARLLYALVSLSLLGLPKPVVAETKYVVQDSLHGISARVNRVENGLLLPVALEGTALVGMSLIERMDFYQTPGVSVALIEDGRIQWAKAYGLRDASGPERVDTETVFQAGSVSKPVTALAAMRLVQDGLLSLDEDVNNKLASWKIPANEFTRVQDVTLWHLLTHTGGVTNHAVGTYNIDDTLPSLLQCLDGLPPARNEAIRVNYVPGTRWRYSGGGFTILQHLLIEVTGKEFDELTRELVFDRIEMPLSTFAYPLPEELRRNVAVGHSSSGDPLSGGWRVFPEMAAAGLWSTPSELARFAIALSDAKSGRTETILTAPTAQMMLSPQFENWGLGLAIQGDRFSHGGDTEGYKCQLVAYAGARQGAVIMTNSERGDRLCEEILRSIAQEYGWPDYQPVRKSVVSVDSSILYQYVGRYVLDLVRDVNIEIAIANQGLTMEMIQSTSRTRATLLPEAAASFFRLEVDQEIVFVRDSSGGVSHLVIHQGDEEYRASRIP